MLHRSFRGALAATLACTVTVAATPAAAETLYGSLAAAYDHNAQLNAQRAATRAADEAIAQAKAGYRPQIFSDVSLGFARTVNRGRTRVPGSAGFSIPADPTGQGLGNPQPIQITPPSPSRSFRGTQGISTVPFSYGVRISQALFSGFQVVNSVNQAEARVRASRAQLSSVEQQVLLATAQAYSDIVFFQTIVNVRNQNIRFLREQVRSAEARLEVGEGTRTDVAQSRAQLALARSQAFTAEGQLRSARAVYRQFAVQPIGRATNAQVPSRLIPSSLSAAVAIGLRENPTIRASEYLVDAQAFAVKFQEGALLPQLSANLSATESYDLGAADSRTTNVQGTLQLSIPIYQGGRVTSQVRQAKETLGQQRIVLDQTRDEVRANVVSAYANLQSARSSIQAAQQQVRAAELAVQGVVEERNVGQRTQLDVLQTRSTLLNAQEQLALSRRDRISASYALLAAIGRLTARHLGLHVDYYDPKHHYVEVVDRWYGLRTPDQR